jgi:ferrochelatase
MNSQRKGLLLINLGTPDSCSEGDVRRYLAEFLSDPRVIDIAAIPRALLLNLIILPFRPARSAEAYAKIFDERGSPLLYHSQHLQKKVQAQLGDAVLVELAMRYGNPSIESALERFDAAGIDRIVVFPLYPQYASSTTGSTIEAVSLAVAERWNTPFVSFVPPFYEHPAFLEAVAQRARPVLAKGSFQRVLFSFHGLPERHLKKGDSHEHCLQRRDCCDVLGPHNRNCYRAQCVATMRAIGASLGLPAKKQVLCFQSRLGRDPWIQPYTDKVLDELLAEGITRVAMLSPAFVADCLETLEELGMAAKERFFAGGGQAFELVENLNASDSWVEAVVEIARAHAQPF